MTVEMEDVLTAKMGFSIVDYVIFGLVLSVSMSIGLYYAFTGGKQKTALEFLMGNRKLSTFPVSLSILVSYVSAILVLGTPAEMYTRGTQLLMRTIGYCLACMVSSVLIVPLFYQLKLTSSFEYLERRYDSKIIKLCGTVMMLIGNVFYMGLVMYSPSTALQAATGFSLIGSVVLTGVVATIYTTLGGMKAVVWTDAFQALVMVGGMMLIVIQGSIEVGGLKKVWDISMEGGRIEFFNFDFDPTVRLTFWSSVIGGMFHTLIAFGVGQTSVQRYCSLPTLKQARRSVFMNIPSLLLVNTLAGLVGLVVYAYYADRECDPLKSGDIANSNQLVPYFVTRVLNYPGIPGVFLAVLFSGALSSISSSLNAASAVTWEDMLKQRWNHLTEIRKTIILKALVIIYGIVSVGLAFLADGLGGHVLWASISFAGATSGPSLGMFLLGALFPWANAKGCLSGFLIASALNLWIAIGSYVNRAFSQTLPTSVMGCSVWNASYISDNGYNNSELYYSEYSPDRSVNLTELEFYSSSASTLSSLTTHMSSDDVSNSNVSAIYGLSFLWYSALGSSVTIIIGLIVSFMTGPQDPSRLDKSLVIPVFDRLCCCLPKSWLDKLHCNVSYKDGHEAVVVLPPQEDVKINSEDPELQDEATSSTVPLNTTRL